MASSLEATQTPARMLQRTRHHLTRRAHLVARRPPAQQGGVRGRARQPAGDTALPRPRPAMKDRQRLRTHSAAGSTRPAAAWRASARHEARGPPTRRAKRWGVDRSGSRGPRPAVTGRRRRPCAPRMARPTGAGLRQRISAAGCQGSPVAVGSAATRGCRKAHRQGGAAMRWAPFPPKRGRLDWVCVGMGKLRNRAAEETDDTPEGGPRRASRPIQHTNVHGAPLGGQVTAKWMGHVVASLVSGRGRATAGGAPLARGGGAGFLS